MPKLTKTKRDWKYVVSHLHYAGSRKAILSADDHGAVRAMADGFGPGNTNPNIIWDWSHVRDSSEQAIANMAMALRKLVRKANKKAAVEQTKNRRNARDARAEQNFEMCAAFGPGVDVVNVFTGQRYRT